MTDNKNLSDRAVDPNEFPAGSKKNHAFIMIWIFIWMVTFVAVDKFALHGWLSSRTMAGLAVAINAAIGVGVLITYMKFLKELDEMQQKIQLSALALAMGFGLVGAVTYALLVTTGLVAGADLSVIIMLLGGGYTVGLVVGRARY